MAKRQTLVEKAIANLDEKIAALQLARTHLLDQQTQQAKPKPARKLRALQDTTASESSSRQA